MISHLIVQNQKFKSIIYLTIEQDFLFRLCVVINILNTQIPYQIFRPSVFGIPAVSISSS